MGRTGMKRLPPARLCVSTCFCPHLRPSFLASPRLPESVSRGRSSSYNSARTSISQDLCHQGKNSVKLSILAAVLAVGLSFSVGSTANGDELRIVPGEVRLDRPESSQQLVVVQMTDGRQEDVTRQVQLSCQPPGLVRFATDGLVQPVTEGSGQIIATLGNSVARSPVHVSGIRSPSPISFAFEVQPILAKGRCNSGGCHGKAEGQNGFKLSLLGFDDDSDYDALVKHGRGRRVSLADPSGSLLLRKAAAITPHGGGLKVESDSPGFQRIRRWIAEGCPRETPAFSPVVRVEVEPNQLVLRPRQQWQLRVIAIDAEGKRRCATAEADFISNAPQVVDATSGGLLQATEIPGDAAILIRYLGNVSVCRVIVPRPGPTFPQPPRNNFIDELAWNKHLQLGIEPSPVGDDSVFLRRAYLDVIGTLPTASEARTFLADASPNKREQLIDSLLNRPEYADYWAMKWANLLRADKIKVTHQGTVGMVRWLRRQFAANRPYDEMAREIATVQGPVGAETPAAFFKAVDQPELASRSVSQLFLGVRIECAQCHHHPSERWSQDDYTALAGFFSGVSIKRLPDGTESVVAKRGTDLKHPRTGQVVPARALGAPTADFTNQIDRRVVMANWMTSPDNPFFARAAANRLWSHYFGRGLVEPIDDLRATNPATNEPLLDALAQHLREVRYDLKAFTRTLLRSRLYQLSSTTTDSNRDDRQHFSHASPRALPAEVLLDAISQSTGSPEKFEGWPAGVRAIQVWDNRMPSYFFRIFGRPARATVCECERSNEPSIAQALHLLNSPEVNAKIGQRGGTAKRLAASSLDPLAVIDEVFLTALSRFPTAEDRSALKIAFESETTGSSREQAVEDVLWAVLNMKEFLYIH